MKVSMSYGTRCRRRPSLHLSGCWVPGRSAGGGGLECMAWGPDVVRPCLSCLPVFVDDLRDSFRLFPNVPSKNGGTTNCAIWPSLSKTNTAFH